MSGSVLAAALVVLSILAQETREGPAPGTEEPRQPSEAQPKPQPSEAQPKPQPSEAQPKPPRGKKKIRTEPAPEKADATPEETSEAQDSAGAPRAPATRWSERDRQSAQNQAKIFFAHIILADAQALAEDATLPFYLENRKITSREELASEWSRNLKGKRTDLIALYNIEILSPAEMEKKYGKPPARLKAFPWTAPRTLVAVANLSGHAAIALLLRTDERWRISGFTD